MLQTTSKADNIFRAIFAGALRFNNYKPYSHHLRQLVSALSSVYVLNEVE